ncbi:MAG: hypothetical protein DRN24_07025 [Thermoplasmata archaeon]|nr:MAG: hypothetical protein DRN24_07025 [Thermoplasmata archaeon]
MIKIGKPPKHPARPIVLSLLLSQNIRKPVVDWNHFLEKANCIKKLVFIHPTQIKPCFLDADTETVLQYVHKPATTK